MDRRIAFHEAGHVVVGRALGQQIGGVTIEPGVNYSGATWGPTSDPASFALRLPRLCQHSVSHATILRSI
jgi:hypothetical protein